MHCFNPAELMSSVMATLSVKWYLSSVLSSNVLKAELNLLYMKLLIGK